MAMTATQQITISSKERVCINCTQYRQCWREDPVPGEVYKTMTPLSFGYCILHERQRGVLYRPCRDYEVKENSRHLERQTPERKEVRDDGETESNGQRTSLFL
ncbi:hypothetical protein D1159_03605 [Pseudoflavonifractor sp. 524-17]|uniref:hypothetical protein n=1 Tax=Pseudoflavonifractor sp. 524-17 TaxID=2304577 RepID=UPI00137B8EA1|nr:hypothetical protein [Pseudoflavonifractor sp. 524-17]NCE63685.1 hypothetical protein [Pseudoflavonifractor sp. 524-17]